MSEKRYKRFYVSESENQLTIYDNEGLDDYYHLGNDERDVKGICKLLNDQQATTNRLEEENDNMNLFIKQTIEPLLFNCVFELNTIESMSQVELANKIENEIIPFIQNFKYLKYESPEEEKQDKSE